ncbi:FMN-binding protein [Actinokineospora auranticolor]|uniref:Uncharacterized protein with FMN-binding domain n=1 Tax=Actinokineospora auranticolor TaxID=155976 RepID=A0A2S6H0S3_9PSEU|nr:FMN-binding protein [Actinokineospora auranticolor]PPK71085.1 uncharacterized protein with FMN-binding domain [Actinokineospora auranticolor]
MKRVVMWGLSTLTVLVLLFGYHTSTSAALPASSEVVAVGTSSGGRTVTGPVAQTRWGAVQVAITLADNKVTAVTVLQSPDANRKDQQINARALPILTEEALDAQSADIDMVSGATVTSEGYRESLQGALDEAGL